MRADRAIRSQTTIRLCRLKPCQRMVVVVANGARYRSPVTGAWKSHKQTHRKLRLMPRTPRVSHQISAAQPPVIGRPVCANRTASCGLFTCRHNQLCRGERMAINQPSMKESPLNEPVQICVKNRRTWIVLGSSAELSLKHWHLRISVFYQN